MTYAVQLYRVAAESRATLTKLISCDGVFRASEHSRGVATPRSYSYVGNDAMRSNGHALSKLTAMPARTAMTNGTSGTDAVKPEYPNDIKPQTCSHQNARTG